MGLDTVTISPLNWREWPTPSGREWEPRPFITARSADRSLAHYLVELGKATNGYRYTVYSKRTALLVIRFKVPCCDQLPKCPLKGRAPLPTECREALREAAKVLAYQYYLTFIKDLVT